MAKIREIESDDRNHIETIDDGFGSVWPTICPQCKRKTIYVNRPGDARCSHCYDGNPIPAPVSSEKALTAEDCEAALAEARGLSSSHHGTPFDDGFRTGWSAREAQK
jgi:hypothetical protein